VTGVCVIWATACTNSENTREKVFSFGSTLRVTRSLFLVDSVVYNLPVYSHLHDGLS